MLCVEEKKSFIVMFSCCMFFTQHPPPKDLHRDAETAQFLAQQQHETARQTSPPYYPHFLLWAWLGLFGALSSLPFVYLVPDGPSGKTGFGGLSMVTPENRSLVIFGLVWNSLFLNVALNVLYSTTLAQLPAALFAVTNNMITPIAVLADSVNLQIVPLGSFGGGTGFGQIMGGILVCGGVCLSLLGPKGSELVDAPLPSEVINYSTVVNSIMHDSLFFIPQSLLPTADVVYTYRVQGYMVTQIMMR